ncbi:MAG: DUF3253 domain-containing protein [Pseudomonadota bacterium]
MTPREAILTLCEARGPGKSICPSEAARALSPEGWRDHMEAVRVAAQSLAAEGRILCTQKGAVVDITRARGPIRLSWAAMEE